YLKRTAEPAAPPRDNQIVNAMLGGCHLRGRNIAIPGHFFLLPAENNACRQSQARAASQSILRGRARVEPTGRENASPPHPCGWEPALGLPCSSWRVALDSRRFRRSISADSAGKCAYLVLSGL